MAEFKGKEVWLAREERDDSCVEIYATKPRKSQNRYFPGYYWKGRRLSEECPTAFKRTTGFDLKPGECVKVRIRVTRVRK